MNRFILIAGMIVLFSSWSFSSDAIGNDRRPWLHNADSLIIHQVYQYRALATRYDSLAVRSVFGEIFIPSYSGLDSLQISWVSEFETPGIDSSAAYLNSILISKPFNLTDTTQLSFWHGIQLVSDYEPATYSVPDTTAWTMELWRKANNTKIASIDSIGICKATNIPYEVFPSVFGFAGANTYELVSIFLGSFVETGTTDSVFLVLRMKNWDASVNPFCSVFDEYSLNAKGSASWGLSKQDAVGDQSSPSTETLSVFPNPSRDSRRLVRFTNSVSYNFTMSLFSSNGDLIATVFRGALEPGHHVIPIDLSNRPSGMYLLRVTTADGISVSATQFMYIH